MVVLLSSQEMMMIKMSEIDLCEVKNQVYFSQSVIRNRCCASMEYFKNIDHKRRCDLVSQENTDEDKMRQNWYFWGCTVCQFVNISAWMQVITGYLFPKFIILDNTVSSLNSNLPEWSKFDLIGA